MADIYAVIMAGGRGERFWPLSTDSLPKPFVPLTGSATLIQETVSRLLPLVPADHILICVGASHESAARTQVPQIAPENFIIEPIGRDTAACLGYCALHIERRNPEGIMLALPADHYIGDPLHFRGALQTGFDNLEGAAAIVFGITPTRPDTGYGYILTEKPAIPAPAWPVLRFVEKPDLETARQYISSGRYFWNSGMFLWRNRTLLGLFRQHMPEIHHRLCHLRPIIGDRNKRDELYDVFLTLPRISIDFGIIEKTSGLRMIPLQIPWDDVGNWDSLERVLHADVDGNVTRGPVSLVNSQGCITYSDAGIIAAMGVTDLVIVQARGRVLVCPKEVASDLKKLVSALDSQWK